MHLENKGFTLIELMIVVAIIGVLAAIGVANYVSATRKSNEALTKGNIGSIRSALSLYYGDNEGSYPIDNLASITTGGRYLAAIPLVRTQPHHADSTLVTAETTVTDTGGWSYYNVETTNVWGDIHVGCLHQDMRANVWSTF